jgi:hypothetical protein
MSNKTHKRYKTIKKHKTRKKHKTIKKHRSVKKRVFTKKHFNAGDGILTSVWGPAMWHYLHSMSFNYPVEPTNKDKIVYKKFILSLQHVLPCKYCRTNLKNNFNQYPLKSCHMNNRETFSRYVYNLHEIINKMLNKTSNLTYIDVRERYEHFRSRCTKTDTPKVINLNIKQKKEKGCTEPLYGKKAKCVINIVPQDNKTNNMIINKDCIKKEKKN